MSGTSIDGVDASIIQSDGKTKYKAILDKYFEYPKKIYQNLTKLRNEIKNSKDLKRFEKQIKSIEKEITLFHAKAVNEILKKSKINVDFIGFHGQTIFHNAKEKISKQLGEGKLLSKLTKKIVIYNFRQNDLKNGGQGAPLTPIFHKLLVEQNKIKTPVIILNIGGITN
jgi:anhydro-N-acetylmuramic acid kinase